MSQRGIFKLLLNRRAFVGMLGNFIGVVALGGLMNFFEPKSFRLMRPPGAVIEEEFISLCIRCDKCRVVCPWQVIRPVRLNESVINAGTPVLDGHCRHCWLCIPVCPTRALR